MRGEHYPITNNGSHGTNLGHHVSTQAREITAATPRSAGNKEVTTPRAGRFISRAVVGVKSGDLAHTAIRHHEAGLQITSRIKHLARTQSSTPSLSTMTSWLVENSREVREIIELILNKNIIIGKRRVRSWRK
jgi:hypothetical protein